MLIESIQMKWYEQGLYRDHTFFLKYFTTFAHIQSHVVFAAAFDFNFCMLDYMLLFVLRKVVQFVSV